MDYKEVAFNRQRARLKAEIHKLTVQVGVLMGVALAMTVCNLSLLLVVWGNG
jgi:hypothetical protein